MLEFLLLICMVILSNIIYDIFKGGDDYEGC